LHILFKILHLKFLKANFPNKQILFFVVVSTIPSKTLEQGYTQ